MGKRIFMHFGLGEPTAVQVIGVVADIKDLGLDAPVEPEISTDLATFTAIALLLVVVALLACYLAARRGTKVNPLTVLKQE